MTASAPLLDATMLAEFEQRLRAAGVPVDRWDKPGLSGAQMNDILAEIGLSLPREARAWWGWHDGSPGVSDPPPFGPPGDRLLSLAEAVVTYREYREIAESLVEPHIPALADVEERWNRSWLPIRGVQLPVVIDCSVAADAQTPVRRIDFQDVEGSPRPRACSLGQMVSWWIVAIDCGAWCWQVEEGKWLIDRDRLPTDLRMHPLV